VSPKGLPGSLGSRAVLFSYYSIRTVQHSRLDVTLGRRWWCHAACCSCITAYLHSIGANNPDEYYRYEWLGGIVSVSQTNLEQLPRRFCIRLARHAVRIVESGRGAGVPRPKPHVRTGAPTYSCYSSQCSRRRSLAASPLDGDDL
jgi:hypothetical protein